MMHLRSNTQLILSLMTHSRHKKVVFVIILFLILAGVVLRVPEGYCQDVSQVLGQAVDIYTGSEKDTNGNTLIGGYTVAGLIGGLLFGGVGFVAFIYGKRNQEFQPMIVGLLLLGYPYFVKDTITLYLAGIVLTVILFIWRE